MEGINRVRPGRAAWHALGGDRSPMRRVRAAGLTRAASAPAAEHPSATVLVADYWTDDPVPEVEDAAFPLWETTDLVLYAYFEGLAEGVHVAWLEYRTPSGGVYLTEPLAFSIGETDVTEVAVDGLLTPVPVEPATSTALGFRANDILPVDGTAIVNYGMSGTWTLSVLLDTADGNPLTTASFDLYE